MPTLANTSRAKLSAILESTFGTTPTTGNAKAIRFTGESLAYAIKTETSKEIRSDRMNPDSTSVSASATGGFNFEMSAKEYDDYIQAALMGTWSDYGTTGLGATFSATIDSAAGTITAAVAPTGTSDFTTLAKGQWIRLTAPSDAANGAYLKISETVAPTTTVITIDASTTIPGTGSRTGVANSAVFASRIKNGTVERSFSIERSFQDIGQFWMFRGMYASKLSLDFKSGALTTGTLDFMGKDAVRASATGMPGTTAASQTLDIHNGVKSVGSIYENGTALASTYVKSMKFDLDNKTRDRDALGVFGNVGIGVGSLSIKGTMEVYLADGTLYDKFVNQTATKLAWYTKDTAGNGYVVTFPKVKFSDAKVNAGGIDQDAMLSIPFETHYDATAGAQIVVDRLYA